MKIAVLAHIRHAIAEPFSGGMEAHCDMLCRGLRAAGHDVDLFAASGSNDPGLIPICDAPYDHVLPWHVYRGTRELAAYQRDAFALALSRVEGGGYDVVHNNSLFPDIIEWCANAGIACVTSQHVPPFGTMFDAVLAGCEYPHIGATVTSRDQLSLWTRKGCDALEVVHNGVDTASWTPVEVTGDYFTWVGRITPNKGLGHAVRAAGKAGTRLKIFGPVEDAAYFAEEVEPFLTNGIEYHGHRSADILRKAVASARGALVTPLWDEPFGLVAAEALSCGTPVIGFNRGALAEVVGDCGCLVDGADVDALAMAIANAGQISRAACRQRAIDHLSIEAMIRGYEGCYAKVISASRLAPVPSLACSSNFSSTSALLA
ncbi:glycosyltransferase [Aurantiacibacter rhizosphaerae]|uniref:Glycosyltransferase n=1 Tax=Aurantiacibacter rhizosphaerae TaxID=2691582 RepID=A0A844XB95_9SPHN|nr:glycosyltransferase [Aurantiacibacter rhizosphaerae]MWV27110.1 glycosyltransferase [Aurantiacibacter rhizosphaerae]